MYSEAVEALLAMGDYRGAFEPFLSESALRIQGVLKCSREEAERILQDCELTARWSAKPRLGLPCR